MSLLYNLAQMTTATVGAGTITLGAASSSYLSFAQAGVQDGDTVSYAIYDQSAGGREVGTGVYTAAGTTLTRNVIKSTNSNNALVLSGSAIVFITPLAEDLMYAPLFAVRAASTGNLDLSGDETIDGVDLDNGDVVMVMNQDDPTENGIYTVNTSGAWARHPNFTTQDSVARALIHVREGDAFEGSRWRGTVSPGGGGLGGDEVFFCNLINNDGRLISTSGIAAAVFGGDPFEADSNGGALDAANSGQVVSNEGASSEANFTLPSAVAGLEYTGVVQDNSGFKFTAASGDTIRIAANATPAAGNVSSNTIGNVVRLKAINDTEWFAIFVIGTWTVSS